MNHTNSFVAMDYAFSQDWTVDHRNTDRRPALPCTLRLQPGHLYKLSGANGSGKSTLLLLLAGLLAPHQTSLLQPDTTPVTRDVIFHLPHNPGLRTGWTGWQNLDYWCALNNIHVKHHLHNIQQNIEKLQLNRKTEILVEHLSAGQKQKMALLRLGLVTGRPLWLLDEPENNLDQHAVTYLGQQVTAHIARGGIVVWATHHHLPIPHQAEITL